MLEVEETEQIKKLKEQGTGEHPRHTILDINDPEV